MLGCNVALHSQSIGVGISDVAEITPHSSAVLELSSLERGFLMPRMSRVQRLAIASPANGLMVIQTDNSSGDLPGVYVYYEPETRWLRLLNSANLVWSLEGNNGTNSSNDFIGTTDLQDFVVRTNNITRVRVLSSGRAVFENGITVKGSLVIENETSVVNSFTSSNSQLSNINYILPTSLGAAGTFLKTDASGNLSWDSPSSASTIGFDQITSGTNTSATMSVGTGSSVILSGTGIIESNIFKNTNSISNSVDLNTDEVAGILSVTNGGTGGNLVPTDGGIAFGDGTKIDFTGVGSTGQLLVSNGDAPPTWQTPNYWKDNGNSGLNPSVNFLGTTDAVDLIFKRNSIESAKITTNQEFEIYGHLSLKSPSGASKELRLFEKQSEGTNYSGFMSDTLDKTLVYSLPRDTVGELAVLVNRGNNKLSWMKTGDLQSQTRANVLEVIDLPEYTIPDTVTHVLVERNGVSRVNLFSGAQYAGKVIFIKRLSSLNNNHFVDVCPASGQKIDRLGTSNLDRGFRLRAPNDAIMAVYDGSNWWIMTAYLQNSSVVTCDCP